MKIFFLILISIISFSSIQSQTVGGSIMLGLPQGEFKTNLERAGYGIQIQGTLWSPTENNPFSMGLNLGYLIYGEESSLRPLSYTIPDVLVDVNRTNSIANFHLLFQITPYLGKVRPYIEGLIGGSYLFTRTSVGDEYDENDVFSTTNFDDFAFSYGGSVGLMILLTESLENFGGLFLDFKLRYLNGSRAEYLREGDIVINPANGDVTYFVSESKTDILTIHVGVSFLF